jgi:GDP-4-dehydro-6-deoxy-D-mannose reductase
MEKKRIAVSGVNGFVGHHLARELKENGVTVIGIGHDAEPSASLNGLIDEYFSQDLTDAWPNTQNIDGVIHLAGLAAVGPSFDDPQRYINMNSAMVTHMGEYFVKQDKKPRLVIVSSGAIYSPTQPLPINEDGKLGLSSPYAVSKVLTENQATYYRGRGLDCVVVRPFNHIGPGQGKGFILPDFYDRIASTKEDVIKVGNISTKRDYTDVRDIVRAYTKIILADKVQESTYNVCSGLSLSGSEILDKLKLTMNRPEIQFEIDPTLVRPTDIQEITGDSTRLQQEFNWHPEFNIKTTIEDFVNSNQ